MQIVGHMAETMWKLLHLHDFHTKVQTSPARHDRGQWPRLDEHSITAMDLAPQLAW
jgi:hypothetical protein